MFYKQPALASFNCIVLYVKYLFCKAVDTLICHSGSNSLCKRAHINTVMPVMFFLQGNLDTI